MKSNIYLTKKLEKILKKLIVSPSTEKGGILGKWNATLFNVSRKKCLLFTNGKTKYNFIISGFRSSDLQNIESHFKNNLYSQFIYDGIIVSEEQINQMIGSLCFMSTDNDKSTTAFQNQRLRDMSWWIDEFQILENMPIRDLTNRMNSSLIHLGTSRKPSDYTTATEEMTSLINSII